MPRATKPNVEAIKLQNDIFLEEYRALKAEYVHRREVIHKSTELSLVAVGVLSAAASFIIQTSSFFIFAIATFMFYALVWVTLHQRIINHQIEEYIINILEPRIRENIAKLQLSGQDNLCTLLNWDKEHRKGASWRSFLLFPIEATSIVIPFLAALFLISIYILEMLINHQPFSLSSILLLLVNGIVLLYTVIVAVVLRHQNNM